MKNKNQQKGDFGEQIAITYLTKEGYTILEHNWKSNRLEIDLIAQKDESLVFFEVKTRVKRSFVEEVNLVSSQQQKRIWRAAEAYMDQIEYNKEIRFDIIKIILDKHSQPLITHYIDAFFPDWD